MIVTELFTSRDGANLQRTYSDAGYYIERDGIMYVDAVDPEGMDRVYTETNVPLPAEEELTAEEALAIITGGEL